MFSFPFLSTTSLDDEPHHPLHHHVAPPTQLLRKKLSGVNKTNASNMEGWRVQILHCWAQSGRVATLVRLAHAMLPRELRANTVCLVTVVLQDRFGLDRVIFGNQPMADLTAPLPERSPAALTPERWRQEQRRAEQQQWRALTPAGGGGPSRPRFSGSTWHL